MIHSPQGMRNTEPESTGALSRIDCCISLSNPPGYQGPEIRTVSLSDLASDLRSWVRREAEVTFDWFKSYKDVAHLLRPVLPDTSARILMLGCGNSTLSEDVCPSLFQPLISSNVPDKSLLLRCMTMGTRISSTSTCARTTTPLIS